MSSFSNPILSPKLTNLWKNRKKSFLNEFIWLRVSSITKKKLGKNKVGNVIFQGSKLKHKKQQNVLEIALNKQISESRTKKYHMII